MPGPRGTLRERRGPRPCGAAENLRGLPGSPPPPTRARARESDGGGGRRLRFPTFYDKMITASKRGHFPHVIYTGKPIPQYSTVQSTRSPEAHYSPHPPSTSLRYFCVPGTIYSTTSTVFQSNRCQVLLVVYSSPKYKTRKYGTVLYTRKKRGLFPVSPSPTPFSLSPMQKVWIIPTNTLPIWQNGCRTPPAGCLFPVHNPSLDAPPRAT